jgi:hypothetical protein
MSRTLSPEMDAWLAEAREEQAIPRFPRRSPAPVAFVQDRDVLAEPFCPLSDAEIDWLWPRFQRCSFPPATFAKRFAKTSRDRLTARGKNAAVSLSYRYRRQIFGKQAVRWSHTDFVGWVKDAASRVGGQSI